jgi:hypothetical protein
MTRFLKVRWILPVTIVAIAALVSIGAIAAGLRPAPAEPDPKVLAFKLPKDIKWSGTGSSPSQQAVLAGDPNKEGIYVVLTKWNPHNMSRPHFHPNDRFIYVISGTWWVGTGPKYDPDSTTPMPAGTFVQHFGKQIHYDGAKDGEVILEIVGMGPATQTAAELKQPQ